MPVFEDESSKGGSGGEGWLKQPRGRSESKIVDRSSRNQAFQLGQGHRNSMAMDTSTVRLVIFLGMFLIFAGDYSYLISTILGKSEQNVTGTIKNPDGSQDSIADRTPLTPVKKNDEKETGIWRRARMMTTIKTACLPKLICELTSSVHQDQLSEMERSLLNLIRDTSLSTMAEVPSRYHFAAHMGQLISGLEGQGCHNFYPTCPLPGASVLSMMKKIRLR